MCPPRYLLSYAAQAFSERLWTLNDPSLLYDATAVAEELTEHRVLEGLMACEIVAASIGWPCGATCWSWFASHYLFKTGFRAGATLVDQCRDFVNSVTEKGHELDPLGVRLNSNPRSWKPKDPSLSHSTARKVARSCDGGVIDNDWFFGIPPADIAVTITHFRDIRKMSFMPSNENLDPVEPFRILLLGGKQTVENLSIQYGGQGNEIERSLANSSLLVGSVEPLAEIMNLKVFDVLDFIVTDSVIEAIAKNRCLQELRIDTRGRCKADFEQIQLSPKAFEYLEACPNLWSVKINSPFASRSHLDGIKQFASRNAKLRHMKIQNKNPESGPPKSQVRQRAKPVKKLSTSIKNPQIRDHQFLAEMYDDDYFPKFLVNKCKAILTGLCESLEATLPKGIIEVFALTHAAVDKINKLAKEFEKRDSELETNAREAIAGDFHFILQAYGFGEIDVEDAISNREW